MVQVAETRMDSSNREKLLYDSNSSYGNVRHGQLAGGGIPQQGISGGGYGNLGMSPQQSHQYGNLGMSPTQQSHQYGNLGMSSPQQSHQYGSLGMSPQQSHQTQQHSNMTNANNVNVNDQELIELAARTLDRSMIKDFQFPSLYKNLTQVLDPHIITGNRPVSGLMDYDYPPFLHRQVLPDKQYSLVYQSAIPEELNEMLNQADVQYCHMGLFPEIYRAWMTIDSDLYLWDFRDGSDLSIYDGLKEPIHSMALVSAKPKIFQNAINHLLCVTTASEIYILGLVLRNISATAHTDRPVIELVSQPIFVIPSDECLFRIIYGTKSGRIFLGGNDGSIHEVNYQSEKGWITDRCWKTNLTRSYLASFFKFISTPGNVDPIKQIVSDDVRHLLYTRSDSGLIQIFELGETGQSFSRIGYMTFDNVVNEVVTISKKTLDSNVVKKILSISPVTSGEINLIAVLDNGTRLYFSCYNPPTQINRTPNSFHLVHVRMPPGYCTATVVPKPSVAHAAFTSAGLLALASRTVQEQDTFWLVNPFVYPTNCYSEVFTIHRLPGQTLDIKLVPSDLGMSSELEHLPDVITQHLNFQREIIVLTSNGTCVFRANKPFEILKTLLIERGSPENVRGHFESGVLKEQPLANTALLAIHPTTKSEPSVLDMAIKTFFMYGSTEGAPNPSSPRGTWGDGPGRFTNPNDTTMDFNPNVVSTPRQDAVGMNQRFASPTNDSAYSSPPVAAGGSYISAQYPQQYQYSSPSTQQAMVEYPLSARHDAIYLVVARILGQFWNRSLVKTGKIGGGNSQQITTPNVEGHEVTQAIIFLQNLLSFINTNPSLYMNRAHVNIAMLNYNTNEGRRLYSQEMEKNSFNALRTFLSMTLEVLYMWKILCDHQFHIVLHGVENQLQNATMKDLVITGQGTVSVIINALISKYLGDNAAVDAISLRLRELCPTLFKSEDAIGSKVAEILGKVKNSTNPNEAELLLKESLLLSEKICGHGRVNVRNLCKQYSDLGFPVGAVRLCISAAKAADPEKLAMQTVKNTSSNDPVGLQAFQTRAEIYRIVFDMLDNYVQLSTSNQSPHLRTSEDKITPQQAQHRTEETIHSILLSDDEIFHIALYNWLLDKKQFDRLLEIKHPFLDSFLQRAAEAVVSGKWPAVGVSANDTRVLDLLWRHHEMNQNHAAAAQILSRLAESTTTGINLQQRLEYMSRAIICSKSCSRRGELLETLEDKVEVAQIQRSVLEAVNTRIANLVHNPDEDSSAELKMLQDSLPKLNSQLLTITQLYAEFAHPLKLNDAKLEIFFVAGHSDRSTIEAVWSEIIEEELANSASRTMESQMEVIRRKLVLLGRKYITSPTFFPVDFLIEHLESMKPQESDNVAWVFRTMLEVGITFPDVLNIYERLWKRLQNSTGTPSGDIQIAKVIMCMIDSLSKQELDVRISFMARPDLLETCKDLISNMIVEFSSRFDRESTEMTQNLNHVRDRLDRVSVM